MRIDKLKLSTVCLYQITSSRTPPHCFHELYTFQRETRNDLIIKSISRAMCTARGYNRRKVLALCKRAQNAPRFGPMKLAKAQFSKLCG